MILPFHSARMGRDAPLRLGTREVLPFVRRPLALSPGDLATHIHCMGLSGFGKSKFLAHLATQLILRGEACSVIDPHADLATDILAILLDRGYFRRPDAATRLLFVDFGAPDAYVPFNFLRIKGPAHSVAAGVLEAFHRAWPALAEGAAPTFDTLILNGVKVLISNHLPLPHLYRLLTDTTYRNHLLDHEPDETVVAVWRTWFDRLSPRDQADQAGAALRRANLLTFHPALRFSLGQDDNRLDFRALMDNQVSVIFNLGGLDAQTQRLLGCLLSVGFETAALGREDVPAERRVPYRLLIDEFSMFSAQSEESLSRVLSLARKYKLYTVLAHQTWSQLSDRLRGALQNSMPVYFRLGFDDSLVASPHLSEADPYAVKHEVKPLARELPMEYHPSYLSLSEQDRLMAQRLEQLAPREAYIRLQRPDRGPLRLFHLFRPARLATWVLKFTAAAVGAPRCTREQVDALKARYARELLTPLALLQGQQARPGAAATSGHVPGSPDAPVAPDAPHAKEPPIPAIPPKRYSIHPIHARVIPLRSPTSIPLPSRPSSTEQREHTLFVRRGVVASMTRCQRMKC